MYSLISVLGIKLRIGRLLTFPKYNLSHYVWHFNVRTGIFFIIGNKNQSCTKPDFCELAKSQ